jgi:hypothetical protein
MVPRGDRAPAADAVPAAQGAVGGERRERPAADRRAAGEHRHRPAVPGGDAVRPDLRARGRQDVLAQGVRAAPAREAKRRRCRPVFGSYYKLGDAPRGLRFDDPDFEDVDVFDFMWDPFGSDMGRRVGRAPHVAVDLEGVPGRDPVGRVEHGDGAGARDRGPEDKLRRWATARSTTRCGRSAWRRRGSRRSPRTRRGEQIHEVWEWHDGERVLTVLDRQVLVQDAENPCVGTIPFHVYRPTPLQKQMVGIGDLEPLEHLQRELDTLRSQRRDAATIALCAGYAYDDGMIDEEDLVFGPARRSASERGATSDALMPLPVPDVPGSGYQEEQVIRTGLRRGVGDQRRADPRRAVERRRRRRSWCRRRCRGGSSSGRGGSRSRWSAGPRGASCT